MHDFWTNSNREYDVHQIAKLHKYGGIEHKKIEVCGCCFVAFVAFRCTSLLFPVKWFD